MDHPAIAYLSHRQYEEGAAFCEQAIVVNPHSDHHWYLGLIRLLQGDEAEAQAVWFSALTAIVPDTLDAELAKLLQILRREAEQQLQAGKANQAERIYRQVVELDGHQPSDYFLLGLAASLQGRLDAAIASWQTATQLDPDLVEAYVQQADVWQRLEHWEQAIAAYQQAAVRQPTYELHYNLGLCFGHQHQWTAALAHFNQTLSLQPDFAPAYGDRAWICLQLNQWGAATKDFCAALQSYSSYAQIYNNWVEQLQENHYPRPAKLAQNATQLKQLCVAAEVVWPQWLEQTLPVYKSEPVSAVDSTPPPTESILDTETWANSQPQVQYIKLDAPEHIRLSPPKTNDRTIHFSFRLEPEILLPHTFVLTLPEGRFWLRADQSSSAILTASNQLVGELSPEFPLLSPGHPDKQPQHHSIFTRTLAPVEHMDGTIAVLSGLTNNMYFHWLFDIVPRFDLLRRSGIELEQIDFFLVSSQMAFQREMLELLGIPQTKILETHKHLHIQAHQLVIPSYPSTPAWMTKRACHWLQKLILSSPSSNPGTYDRLYITREQASTRRIINESEVIAFLQPLGFQPVVLESLSVREQGRLLASANVVISAHGGGLTNLTFCQPGTTVIEIFSPNFVYPCYWLICNLLNLDYYYLTGTVPGGYFLQQQLYPNPRTEDILVDLAALKQVLQLANIAD
jgi:capsular polysaccharide biosynthesis protein/tetratricopeptide (TPR) repeat protein